jgi:hypothetical protein
MPTELNNLAALFRFSVVLGALIANKRPNDASDFVKAMKHQNGTVTCSILQLLIYLYYKTKTYVPEQITQGRKTTKPNIGPG